VLDHDAEQSDPGEPLQKLAHFRVREHPFEKPGPPMAGRRGGVRALCDLGDPVVRVVGSQLEGPQVECAVGDVQ
jgi:hypothetical protein